MSRDFKNATLGRPDQNGSGPMTIFRIILGLLLSLTLLAFLPPVTARGQTLVTVAGGGTPSPTPGNEGDGGPATVASLAPPEDIAFDSQGNLYIATADSKVRKVDAVSGIISTVAGSGVTAYSGDGGPATLAALEYPSGIAFDSQDNLYISDFYNNVVRKVSAAGGTITTVVGVYPGGGYSGDNGPATQANLNNPQGLKFDSQGNLYIADSGNHVVRRVAAATGTITTVVGSATPGYSGDGGPATQAQLTAPEGLAFDGSGNLYISDDGEGGSVHVVREVPAATGLISTVAGSATPGSLGDNGPATAASLGGEVDGVVVDCNGNLLIADGLNHRVRRVSGAPGTITTLLGNGTAGYSNNVAAASALTNHPEALALNRATGDLFLANYGSGTVQKISPYCPPTPTHTPTSTSTNTAIITATSTNTSALTPTHTSTATPSSTPAGTATSTAAMTATVTPTYTPIMTATSTNTAAITPTSTPSISPTLTITPVFTVTSSPTPPLADCGRPIDTYCYPDPVTCGSATIFCNLCESGQVDLNVYNAALEWVMTSSFNGNPGANYFPVDTSGLTHGIYYYLVKSQGASGVHESNTAKFAVIR